VKLRSGKTLPVEKLGNSLRCVKLDGMQAMEQNKGKASKWAKMAQDGVKITWFVTSLPKKWGRIVDGKICTVGEVIAGTGGAVMKRPAGAPSAGAGEAAGDDSMEVDEEPAGPPPSKKAKVEGTAKGAAKSAPKAASKAAPKTAPKASAKAATAAAGTAGPVTSSAAAAAFDASDTLGLHALFEGAGHGAAWEPILRPVIEKQPDAAKYIGPSRSKRIVPVRELTFQALKPNPPSGFKVVSFGQSPFPRIESATGIAHFDNAISSWDDGRFGAVVTMRCIIKAAAMNKYKVAKNTSTAELRALMKKNSVVGPAEWFQAMLTQGVLFMNAACTLLPPEDKSVRAGTVVKEHAKFWQPVVEAVVEAILSSCRAEGTGVVFAWWGAESLETKKMLAKECFKKFGDVDVRHIDHKNPAAMGDAFCDDPNIFGRINNELKCLGRGEIDWLPSSGWQRSLGTADGAAAMGDFIAETQALHKMYLERLKDGLDNNVENLADIVGIEETPLVSLLDALTPLKLAKAAENSVKLAGSMTRGALSVDEAASVHMYTTNFLYKMLNASLRSSDRKGVTAYFSYLRLLLNALQKLPVSTNMLYRGVALDLSKEYPKGAEVTWWAVSSCTPSFGVAKGFGGSKSTWTLFLIKPRTSVGIKHMSQYKNEEEFVLAPGTQFKVTEVVRKGSCVEVHMCELDRQKRVR